MDRQALGTSSVIRANSRHLPLPDDSVDLVVTSPPYFALRSYQDGGEHYPGQVGDEQTPAAFVDSLLEVTRECIRVLKPSGSLWVNLGDKYSRGAGLVRADGVSNEFTKTRQHSRRPENSGGVPSKSLIGVPWRYAIRCIDDLGLILRAEVVWLKPNVMPEPGNVRDRAGRSHEQWFHFTLRPNYYANTAEIRPDGEKLPPSVWTIPTQPLRVPDHLGIDHFAAFPMEWPRRIIRGWSPEGGTVLDPFGGTGTTALVAKALGRHGITVDMSADYCRLAEWRTNDPDQLAAAMQVDKPAKQVDGQADLFDLLAG